MFLVQRLCAELSLLNLNLPAKVFVPFDDLSAHHIVRIPQKLLIFFLEIYSDEKVRFFKSLQKIRLLYVKFVLLEWAFWFALLFVEFFVSY